MAQTSTIENTPEKSPEIYYSLPKIAALWAATTIPMVLLAWLVAPTLIPHLDLPAAISYWLVLLPGMIWQFALALWLIRRERGSLHWEAIRSRIGWVMPRHPRTGEQRSRLLWRATPGFLLLILFFLLEGVMALAFLFIYLLPTSQY